MIRLSSRRAISITSRRQSSDNSFLQFTLEQKRIKSEQYLDQKTREIEHFRSQKSEKHLQIIENLQKQANFTTFDCYALEKQGLIEFLDKLNATHIRDLKGLSDDRRNDLLKFLGLETKKVETPSKVSGIKITANPVRSSKTKLKNTKVVERELEAVDPSMGQLFDSVSEQQKKSAAKRKKKSKKTAKISSQKSVEPIAVPEPQTEEEISNNIFQKIETASEQLKSEEIFVPGVKVNYGGNVSDYQDKSKNSISLIRATGKETKNKVYRDVIASTHDRSYLNYVQPENSSAKYYWNIELYITNFVFSAIGGGEDGEQEAELAKKLANDLILATIIRNFFLNHPKSALKDFTERQDVIKEIKQQLPDEFEDEGLSEGDNKKSKTLDTLEKFARFMLIARKDLIERAKNTESQLYAAKKWKVFQKIPSSYQDNPENLYRSLSRLSSNDKKIENIRKNYGNQYQGTSFQSHLCVSVEKLEEILGEKADGYHEVLVNYLTGEIVSYDVDKLDDILSESAELPENCVKLSFNIYEAAKNSLIKKGYDVDKNRALEYVFNIRGRSM